MRLFKWLIKAAAAGILALLLLCALCFFYYNVPVHYYNETGATEYRWEGSKFFRKGTEGFAFGRTNNDGFVNLSDYSAGEKIDILLMGSSHMEAMNVSAKENTAAKLNELFAGELYTYSIGTSGHTLCYCVKHLDAALSTYAPGEYVVLETAAVEIPAEELEAVLLGTLPEIPSQSGGLIGLMQKLPYLRLFYMKYVKGINNDGEASADETAEPVMTETDRAALLDSFMAKIKSRCSEHGVQPIIVYHSQLLFDDNGEAYTDTDADALSAFSEKCESNNISFINLEDSFIQAYQQYHRLPYGFANTPPGAGHMNSWGHMLFAQSVYDAIMELEK